MGYLRLLKLALLHSEGPAPHARGGSECGEESGERSYYHLRHELYDFVFLHTVQLLNFNRL